MPSALVIPVLFGTNFPDSETERVNLTPSVSIEHSANQSKLAGRLLPGRSQTYLVTLIAPVESVRSAGMLKKVQVRTSPSPRLKEMSSSTVLKSGSSGSVPQ